MIRIIKKSDLSYLLPFFEEKKDAYLSEFSYSLDILNSEAGNYLRFYILFTHEPEMIKRDFSITDEDVLYNRLYWLEMVSKSLQKSTGTDHGVGQQVFMLIEEIDRKVDEIDWKLIEEIKKSEEK